SHRRSTTRNEPLRSKVVEIICACLCQCSPDRSWTPPREPGGWRRGSATPATGPARLPRPRAKNRPCGLVTLALVDQGDQRLVRAHAAQVLAERVDDTLGAARRAAGGVRGHDRARMGPEAMVGRERLRVGDVETGAADRRFIERFEKIVAVDDCAMLEVDQIDGLLDCEVQVERV